MENIYLECESSFEGSMQHINFCLESAIFTYTENLLTNHYVTEAVKEDMWTKLKKFFAKFILSIKTFTKELQLKIEYIINEKKIKHKLDSLHKELKENQSLGMRTVELVDYDEMTKTYIKYYNELVSYAKKFSKIKYTKTWQIEDDLDSFEKLIEKFNTDLEKASEKKIKMSIKTALSFVEDEIRGKSEVLKTLNDYTKEVAEIEQIADNLKTKMDILGADVIPKHVGFIRKLVNSIGSFIRKWTVKIIMGTVFLFTI